MSREAEAAPELPHEVIASRETPRKTVWPGLESFAVRQAASLAKNEEAVKLANARYMLERAAEEKLRDSQVEREKQPMSVRLGFDKEKLKKVVENFLKNAEKSHYEASEIAAKRKDLDSLIECVEKLPDNLTFQPGITLIVGDNGSGKSTIAHALYYAMRYQSLLDSGKSADYAFECIYAPRSSRFEVSELARAGIAPLLAQSMHLEQKGISEYGQIDYHDLTRVAGMDQSIDFIDDFGESRSQGTDRLLNNLDLHQSNRQTVDKTFTELKDNAKRHPTQRRVIFVDEPEIGASPRRQMKLAEELQSLVNPGSIEIVPTNSLALFNNQNIPRIDLDYPERGIHLPSDYQE
jgi:predicted ATPase